MSARVTNDKYHSVKYDLVSHSHEEEFLSKKTAIR